LSVVTVNRRMCKSEC